MSRITELIDSNKFIWIDSDYGSELYLPLVYIQIINCDNGYRIKVGPYTYPKFCRELENAKKISLEIVGAVNALTNEKINIMLQDYESRDEIELKNWKVKMFG